MAKVKGPLLSMDARGQIGKALVFLGWKGLKTVRSFVIPANPKTAGQVTQRGYMTTAVGLWHSTLWITFDLDAWRLLAAQAVSAMSGFNVFCKNIIELLKSAFAYSVAYAMTIVTNTGGEIAISYSGAGVIVQKVKYGYSPTVMGNSVVTVHAGEGDPYTATLPALTVGEYVYFQAYTETAEKGILSGIYKVLVLA